MKKIRQYAKSPVRDEPVIKKIGRYTVRIEVLKHGVTPQDQIDIRGIK